MTHSENSSAERLNYHKLGRIRTVPLGGFQRVQGFAHSRFHIRDGARRRHLDGDALWARGACADSSTVGSRRSEHCTQTDNREREYATTLRWNRESKSRERIETIIGFVATWTVESATIEWKVKVKTTNKEVIKK